MQTFLPHLAVGMLSTPEIVTILIVVLLLFGAKRLPELARSFGKSLKEFKKAASDVEDTFRTSMEEEDRKKLAQPLPPPPASTPPAQFSPPPSTSVDKPS
jgi:TatA/E family protein of Tat protein translocase